MPNDYVSMVLSITRGIVFDQRVRRSVLFVIVMAALVMLFGGAVLFGEWLGERPILFVFYWLACLWLTLCSFLMALYDMLMIRKQAQAERRRLQREIFGEEKE